MKNISQKEIEQLYEYIMNKEVEKANQFILKKNQDGLSKSMLLKQVSDYAKSLQQIDQTQFKANYSFLLSSSFEYFKVTMGLMKEFAETGKIRISLKTDFSHIRMCLRMFSKKYPEYSNEVQMIKDILTEEQVNLSSNNIDTFFHQEYHTAAYEDKLYMVATSAYPVITFSRLGWSEKYFKQVMVWFRKKYADEGSLNLAENFENWFYESFKQTKQKQMIEDLEVCTDHYTKARNILYELLSSGLSIYEYCHKYGKYRVSEIRKYIKEVYTASDDGKKKVSEIISEIESREQSSFMEELSNIAIQIQENPNFTILDYYLLTKLNPEDFYDKIGFGDIKVARFANANSVVKRTGMRPIVMFNPEDELMVTRTIKGREIQREEKEMIFKYLEANAIPIDQYTYRACLMKLVNNDLEFNQKLKTYTKGSF